MILHVRKVGDKDVGYHYVRVEDLKNTRFPVIGSNTGNIADVVSYSQLRNNYEFRLERMERKTYPDSDFIGLGAVYSQDWPLIL